MPSFSPDGKTIYFVRDRQRDRPLAGGRRGARLPDDDPERHEGRRRRQQRPGPGHQRQGQQERLDVAVMDPRAGPVAGWPRPWRWSRIAQTRRAATSSSSSTTRPPRSRRSRSWPRMAPLGHQDPTWRPDGKVLLYVRNGRDGPKGAPAIWRWDATKGKASGADRARLPRAELLARTAAMSPRPRPAASATTWSSSTRRTAASCFGSPTTGLRGHRSGRRSATRSRSCTSQGQIVDLELVRLDGTPRTGRSRTSSR